MDNKYDMTNIDLIHGGDGCRASGIKPEKFESLKKLAGEEKVNHPSHYNREDAMECIDEMVLVFGREAVKNFCLCNVWKYRYRASDKNGEVDLEKSDWYMKKYKELSQDYIVKKPEKEYTFDITDYTKYLNKKD